MRFIIQCSHIAIHSGIYPFIHSFSKYRAQLGLSSGLDAGSTRASRKLTWPSYRAPSCN